MRHRVYWLFAAFAVFVVLRPALSQKFLPKSVQFNGVPEYSNQELMSAAGLKTGVVLSYADMNDISKRLMDTGVFSALAFKFDGQDLIFTITPSPDLYPIQIDNLPLLPSADLNAKLHDQLPLFHGKVPEDGGLTEAVRAALEKMLTDRGLEATVVHTTLTNLGAKAPSAVTFSVSSPPVVMKVIQFDGVSVPHQDRIALLTSSPEGVSFDAHSAENLQRLILQYYNDRGYAAAKANLAISGNPSMDSGHITVPFSLHVEEGRIYNVKSIQLPPDTPVTQTEIDKALAPSSDSPMIGVRVRSVWALVSLKYHSKGYLDCKITPHAMIDDADGTVSYTVDVVPGPVYQLGIVKFDNVSDDLRTLLIRNWQMMPGDPFDESYLDNFIVKAQMQDRVLQRALSGVKAKFEIRADPNTHIANVVIRLEK